MQMKKMIAAAAAMLMLAGDRKKMLACLCAILLMLAGCASANAVVVTTPEATPIGTPMPTPVATPSPTPIPTMPPEPTPEPYFTANEQATVDAENGYWLYSSPTVWVEVNRVYDEETKITYLAAEVRCAPGELARGGLSVPGKTTGKNVDLYKIVRNYRAVIAVNGDFLNDHPEDPKGENATLVFLPDGTMRVFAAGEATAKELLEQGVTNAFSFGPVLVNGGVVQEKLDKHRLRRSNPRAAVGMIEANHFVLILVQGRPPEPTNGMTLTELAELFVSYGCEVAYNLDGGASATMAFMGEHISKYKGKLTGQRRVADALMFGTSELIVQG